MYPYTLEEYKKETLRLFKEKYPKRYNEDKEIIEMIENDYNGYKKMYESGDKRHFKDKIELEVLPTVCNISMW